MSSRDPWRLLPEIFLCFVLTLAAASAALLGTPLHASAALAGDCTIGGTAGGDRLVGTAGSDVICAGGGSDTLLGRGGNDVLIGGAGADTLVGGLGADRLQGSAGADTVSYADHTTAVSADLDGRADDGSRSEQDRILTDVESLVGGDGRDSLLGDAEPNTLNGGDGVDTLTGGGASDVLVGVAGGDTMLGGAGDDSLSGGAGNDVLNGGAGTDSLNGGTGVNNCYWNVGEPFVPSCRYDWTGPTISEFQVSQTTLSPGDTFRISARVADPAGVQRAGFTMYTPELMFSHICGQTLTLTEGTASDGYWTAECTVPTLVRNGSYDLAPFARDNLGNETNNDGDRTPTVQRVTVVGGSDDSVGPRFPALTVSKTPVSPGESFVISARVVDPSGVEYAGFYFTINDVQSDFCGQDLHLTAGTATDGTWTTVCKVPAAVRSATYTITPYGKDGLGNYTNTNGGTRSATRATFDVVAGSDDIAGPRIPELTATPNTVQPGETFQIRARVTDPSGVASAGFYFWANGVQADFCGQTLSRTEGAEADGYWTFTCEVPAVVRYGEYVIVPFAKDSLGNYTNVNGGSTSTTRASFSVVEPPTA